MQEKTAMQATGSTKRERPEIRETFIIPFHADVILLDEVFLISENAKDNLQISQ